MSDQPTKEQLHEALGVMIDTVIWMSGSPSFNPEGECGEAWANISRPNLWAAMAVHKAHQEADDE